MVDAVLKGGKPEVNDTKTYDNGVKVVPSYLLQPVVVDKDNYQKVLVDSGYYKARPAASSARSRTAARASRPAAARPVAPAYWSVRMADDILEMRGITKTFPGVKALEDVNLSVRRGEIHAICGENGAGKSTLMKVLSGVYPHGTYDGEILFEGEPCAFADIRDSEQPRHRHHPPGAGADARTCRSPRTSSSATSRPRRGVIDWNRTNREAGRAARAGRACEENPGRRSLDIGVGKQQLVEIAKALSKEVKLLILDEPTAALNDDDSAHLLDLLRGLQDAGHHLDHHLPQAQRDRSDRRLDHDHPRRPDDRDARHARPTRSPRTGSSRGMVGRDLEHRFPTARAEDRRGGPADRGLDGAQPDAARPRSSSTAPTSTCAAARSSASPA